MQNCSRRKAKLRRLCAMSVPSRDEMSEKDRMLAGRYYYAVRDPQLLRERQESQALCAQYNATKGRAIA